MPLSVGSPTILTVLTAIAWDFKLVPAAAPSAPARANEREIGHLARVKRLLARPASGTVVTLLSRRERKGLGPARPAPLGDLVGDPLVPKNEVSGRLAEGRVDDGVLDDDVRHSLVFLDMCHLKYVEDETRLVTALQHRVKCPDCLTGQLSPSC